MKRKLLIALTAFVLLSIACLTAFAAGEVTLSWTQAAATCSVSDAYYCTADGATAFIAGGLTSIPTGADVYITLKPLDAENSLGSVSVSYDGETAPLDNTEGDIYHFVMPDIDSGSAEIIVECGKMYAISFSDGFTLGDDGCYTNGLGKLSTQNSSGVNAYQALAGDTVTLQVQPGDEYALGADSLFVTTASDQQIALSKDADGAYTFVMPEEPVTIAAEFMEAAPINIPDGVDCIITGDYAYQDPPRALVGSSVELKVSPSGTDMRIRKGSQGIMPIQTGRAEYLSEQDETGAFIVSLTMPEGGVDVLAEVGRLCRIECASGVKVYASDRSTEVTNCCEGEELYVDVDIPDGYGLVNGKLTVTRDGQTISAIQHSLGGYDASDSTILLTAPAGDIRLDAEVGMLYSLGNVQTHGMGVVRTYPSTSAAAGSTVTVALMPSEGWQVKEGTLEVCVSGSHTKAASVQGNTFIMPENDCEISVEFEAVPCNVEILESSCFTLKAEYVLSADATTGTDVTGGVPAGALVNVYVLSDSDCVPDSIYLYDEESGEEQELSGTSQASFVMPAHNVKVYAVCSDQSHARPTIEQSTEVQVKPTAEPTEQPQPTQQPTAEPTTQPEQEFPYTATVKTEERSLRMRKDCNADAKVVDKYESGTKVTVEKLSDDGLWAYVTVEEDGKSGWMSYEYLVPEEDSSDSTESSDTLSSSDEEIKLTITLPEIRILRPYLIEKTVSDDGYVFKHILLL